MPRRLSRLETIDVFQADMARLLGMVEDLTRFERDQTVEGAWTTKDILAHIAAWDRELVRGLHDVLQGRRPGFAGINDDDFNAAAVEATRQQSFDDILAETKAAHLALIGAIEALTDEEWRRPTRFNWGRGRPMTAASLFYYLYKGQTHYGGHATDIESWRSSPVGPSATMR